MTTKGILLRLSGGKLYLFDEGFVSVGRLLNDSERDEWKAKLDSQTEPEPSGWISANDLGDLNNRDKHQWTGNIGQIFEVKYEVDDENDSISPIAGDGSYRG